MCSSRSRGKAPHEQIRRHLVLGLQEWRQRLGPLMEQELLEHKEISPSWQEQQKSNVWDP